MPTEITIWDDNSRTVSTGPDEEHYKEWDYDKPLPEELVGLMLDIAKGHYSDWAALVRDLAEDESIIERVLENKGAG